MGKGLSNQRTNRHDQWIAGLCAVLAHAILIILLAHRASSGQGSYKGPQIGRGDALVAYPMLLTPSLSKVPSASTIVNPITIARHQATPTNPPSTQAIKSQDPNALRPIRQIDLSKHANTSENRASQHTAQLSQETASAAASASNGGNTDNDLLSSYQAAIRAAIFRTWQRLSKNSYPNGCTIHISQSPGGIVTATSAAVCGLSKEDRLQLEAAALMAQPMPYAGYESVFSSEMDLTL